MIINESIPKDNITVIRKDGKELDVGVFGIHPQTSEEEYLREDWWFYENTQNPKLKEMFLDLFAIGKLVYINGIDYTLRHIPEVEPLLDLDEWKGYDIDTLEVYYWDLCSKIYKEMSREFMFVRYGGAYSVDARDVDDCYFRIDPSFNWYDIIWNYCMKHKNDFKYINVIYYGHAKFLKVKNKEIRHMPVGEFLTLPGNPVIE